MSRTTQSRSKKSGSRLVMNQRRAKPSFAEMISSANRRAHEQANRRMGRRGLKSVRAAISASSVADDDFIETEWPKRLLRWLMALALLPPAWVTAWTFLSQFSHATVHKGFWQSSEFWYFATGGLLMIGWFWSGLLQPFFLYLYVLGHELTHAVFVVLFRGKVTDFHVSTEGGYITTNKTNLMIALSPYFVPFWSVVAALLYLAVRHGFGLSSGWDKFFYAVVGLTWTFHIVWTLWMIPRDQPDLKENGTFLSLVVIFLANLLILVALLCVASDSPWAVLKDFAREWLRHATTWGDAFLRGVAGTMEQARAGLRL